MTSFGWGQRACLGQTLTQDEMLIACASLAQCFDMGFKIDEKTGEKIDIPLNKSNSLLIIKPDPFQMSFKVRSEKRAGTIRAEWFASKKKDEEERAAFTAAAEAIRKEKA